MAAKTWDEEWLVRKGNYPAIITPEIAHLLLERNTNNRRPKERKIEQYKRDMQSGSWDADASDIKVARTGELIDGQNRLMACVRAGVPFPTLLRTGLGLATKAKVDTGSARTIADVLKMNGGFTNPSAQAAAATLWVRYTYRIENFGGKRMVDPKGPGGMSHDEVLSFLDKHPTIQEFGNESDRMRRVLPALPTSSILTALAMGAEIDPDLAHRIVDRLVEAEYGGIGDPLQALVAYAAMARGRQQGSPGYRGRQAQESHLLILIRVWNALRQGEKITTRLLPRISDILVMPV